jgi:DNA invertase Pin-like site-specific DNA recombinase
LPSPFSPGDRVCAYFRDSGGEDQDLSVDQQSSEFSAWCKASGLVPGRVFIDRARPGSSVVGREDFLAMMRHFRSGEASEKGLVVWKYSRFSRDVDDAAFYRADLRRLGFIIHSLHDNIPEGPEGRFFEAAIDWMNQRFLEDLSTDVRRGLRSLVQSYGCVPGVPPNGFKREPVTIGTRRNGQPLIAHRWVPDPELVPLIRQAFEMRAAGSTLIQIHRATKLYGSLNSYRTFFNNRIYLGILEFGDLTIEDYCEPFVDLKTWDAVQVRIVAHAQARFGAQHPRRANSIYLLSGLVHCARCGSPMYGNTVTRNNTYGRDEAYRCSRARRRRDCDAGRISRRHIEDAVLNTLRESILMPEHMLAMHHVALSAQGSGEKKRQDAIRTNVAQRREISAKIANLTKAIAESGHSAAMLDALSGLELRRTELQVEHDRLQIPIQQIPQLTDEQIEEKARRLVERLSAAPMEERRLILRGLVQRISAEREGRTIRGLITYFYPPPFDLAPMLSMESGSMGAPLYRQTFSYPFEARRP